MRLPTLYHVVVIPGASLAAILALGFLRYTSAIETHELRFRLNSLAVRSAWADPSDLLLRLKAEQQANQKPDNKAGEEEFQLLAAFSERGATGSPVTISESPMSRFYRNLITGLQRVAGIRPAQHMYLESGPDVLTLAYNLERRRLFSEALLTFQKGLNDAPSAVTRDFILLHSGYCQFFLADYDAAEKLWAQVEKEPATAANADLAARLRLWLAQFRTSRSAAAQQRNAKLRAKEYYRILAYKESLDALLAVRNAERDSAYYLLRGRVKEAPGDFTGAVEDYTQVMSSSKNGDELKAANRRLYAMSAFYRPQPKLAELSLGKAGALGDAAFFKGISAYRTAMPMSVPAEKNTDYAGEQAYRRLMTATGEKILKKTAVSTARRRTLRIKTHNGSVITGREVTSGASVIVLENENGRFRIPTADIESKEIVSGN